MKIELKNLSQFLKFSIVGISNTLISLFVYYILIYFNIHYIIANIIGFIVSVLNSYYWNRRYVFKRDMKINAIIKIFISYGITLILNTTLLYIMVNYLKISSYIAPIINVFIITPVNYRLNKYWVFK